MVSGVRGEPDRNSGGARSAVLRPGHLEGGVRQHVQVRADDRIDQRPWQVRGRARDAVQQSLESLSFLQLDRLASKQTPFVPTEAETKVCSNCWVTAFAETNRRLDLGQ